MGKTANPKRATRRQKQAKADKGQDLLNAALAELTPVMASRVTSANFKFNMTPMQRLIYESKARFRVVACGRRAGKTYLGAIIAIETALRGKDVWWIAPTYEIGLIGLHTIKRLAAPVGFTENRTRRLIQFSKGFIQVKSADKPDNLRGAGLDLAIFDEAALMPPEIWNEILRPTLMDRQGQALFLSTPKGLNWFHEIFRKGLEGESDWASFNFPTSTNIFLPKIEAEIEAAKAAMPDVLFKQEILAEFIDDVGGVFSAVLDNATLSPEPPIAGALYSAGIDLARLNDYTVVSILRTDVSPARQVFIDRFHQMAWQDQIVRIANAISRYKPQTVRVDQTGVGDAVLQFARSQWAAHGASVIGVTLTNEVKTSIIQNLALALEKGNLLLLNDPVQKIELVSFEMERLSSGRFRYGAPSNKHDDTVIALALAAQSITSPNDVWCAVW